MRQQIVGKVAGVCGKARLSVVALLAMAFLVTGYFVADSIFPKTARAAAAQLLHNSANTGTKYGSWGTDYTCATCHEKLKTSNIKKVKTSIDTPIGPRPVIFSRYTAASDTVTGEFGNDLRTNYADGSRNVCEVCHHQTIYHNYSATKIVNAGLTLAHPEHKSNRRDCNACHKHNLGYRPPQAGLCTDCHGVPPTNPSLLASNALGPAPPPDAGAHGTHRSKEGMECHTCHNNFGHGLLGNSMIEFGFRIDKKTWSAFSGISTVMSGTVTGTNNAAFNNNFAVAPGNPGTVLDRTSAWGATCSVYCHGDGWAVPSGKAFTGQISWTNGPLGSCSVAACHGTTSANPPNPGVAGAHMRHVGDLQLACTKCHLDYISPHMVNGRVTWDLSGQGATATYKGFQHFSTATLPGVAPYGDCDNIYCHSNIQPQGGVGQPDKYKSIRWGSPTTLACDGCHGGKKTDGLPIASGAHTKHMNSYPYTCSVCHNGYGADGALMNHLDNNIEVVFNSYSGSYDQMPVNNPGNGYGNCSANYCHSDGRGNKKSVSWGTAGPLACNACHKADQPGNAINSGKHTAHVDNTNPLFSAGNYGCVTCHANTVSDNTSISNTVKHVNKLADYSGARAGSYTRSTGLCSVSYCHSDGKGGPPAVTVGWKDGSTITDCKGCHGNSPGGTFVSAAGEPNYANTGADKTYSNSHDRHMGGIGMSTCIYCHNDTVSTTGLKAGTLHLNGSKNIAPGGGKSFTYLGDRTCSNISCHGGTATIKWGQSLPADCTGCHGNNALSFAPISTGKHKSHINNKTVLGKNYPCATCHALTANPDDRGIADASVHGNGFKNFTSALAGGRSYYDTTIGVCSATYCHTDGKGQRNVPFTDLNGWKSGAVVTLDCTGCHGNNTPADFTSTAGEPNYASTGAGAERANDHRNHVDNGKLSCASCHADTVNADGTIIVDSTTHIVDRKIDVKGGNGQSFAYDEALKSCSGISCHGGKGSFTKVWGSPVTADCTGCHGNNYLSFSPISSGRHKSHINNAATLGANYNCTECHAKTINPDERSFANRLLHGNGYVDYSGARAGKGTSYDTALGACSATYCHTDGKGKRNITFDLGNGWKSTTVFSNCIGCHGNNSPADFTSVAGEPNYANSGAPGSAASNSHKLHVGSAGAVTCAYCHSGTVNTDGATIKGNHINGTVSYESSAIAGKTFTPGAGKSCSNIACHGAGAPAATWGANLGCTGCHGGNAGTAPGDIKTGRHTAHIDNPDIGTNLGCVECHAQVVSSDTIFSDQARHADGFPNYSGAMAGRNKAACNTAYCHSNGKDVAGAAVDWNTSTAFMNCVGCHGTATGAGTFVSQAGEPNYANSGAPGSATSNSHQSHTASGASTCDTCHTNTVIANGTAIKPGSLHLNRAINVDFNRTTEATAAWDGGLRKCSNITCHSNGSATWGDASSVGCKVCHGGLNSKAGVHSIHINDLLTSGLVTFYNYTANKSSGTYYRFGCANCHPADERLHRNGVVDVTISSIKRDKFNSLDVSHLGQLNTLATADGINTLNSGITGTTKVSVSCKLSYCHSNGKSTSLAQTDYKASPNWYTTTPMANRCGMCHDNPPQYPGQSHYVANSSLGDNGSGVPKASGHMVGIHFRNNYKGNKQSGFLGFSSSGDMAHGNKAYANTISCNICHSGIVGDTRIDTFAMYTTTTSRFRCASCHTATTRTPLQTGEIIDTGKHINGMKDIAFPTDPVKRFFNTKAQLANVANALGWTRNGSYKTSGTYDSADLGVSTWDSGTKTCLTACHVNQPNITWGAQLKCVSCHANQ